MDRSSIFVALSHMEGPKVDSFTICELYAATVADIAEKISNDEMRRLLVVGAYLFSRERDSDEPGQIEFPMKHLMQ
ncbi:hypothetical protein [Noviherbaspirillum galbum]|uniref:Uncharacterized protein n=1 Tax=Noviherbaspirillum galbum TaxID=2709383 RepID=A0A6B3SI33_9BURK|nr:hypothetical protein [Noviherbaspirillum galbum]NEX60320.1 hypothetical protein [Noviherbaspirillum galbum]